MHGCATVRRDKLTTIRLSRRAPNLRHGRGFVWTKGLFLEDALAKGSGRCLKYSAGPLEEQKAGADEENGDIGDLVGRHVRPFLSLILLSIVTCNLLFLTWWWRQSRAERSVSCGSDWTRSRYLLWCIMPGATVLIPQELEEEGLNLIWLWDNLFLYDMRLQSDTEDIQAISSGTGGEL